MSEKNRVLQMGLYIVFVCYFLCLSTSKGQARAYVRLALPQQVAQADIICVASPTQITPPTKSSISGRDIFGVIVFHVKSVLKGKAPVKTIQISISKDTVNYGLLGLDSKSQGEHFVLLIRRPEDAAQGDIDPSDVTAVIAVGNGQLSELEGTPTLLRKILVGIVQSLSIVSRNDRITNLQRIAETFQRLSNPNLYYHSIWQALGEDSPTDLLAFGKTHLLPDILNLEDTDLEMRVNILRADAALQDMSALPQLRAIAETRYPLNSDGDIYASEAAYGLRLVQTPDAVPFWLSAAGSKSPNVRNVALSSLARALGKGALPLLIDHLDDPGRDMQALVLRRLPELTAEPNSPSVEEQTAAPKKAIAYWHQWATSHQAELQALRKRLPGPAHPWQDRARMWQDRATDISSHSRIIEIWIQQIRTHPIKSC